MNKRVLAFGVLVMVGAALGSGIYWQSHRVTDLSQILADPKAYEGKTVRVRGEVKQEASLLGLGGYLLADDSAQIVVVTDHNTPVQGTTVTVRGTVEDVASFLGKRIVILREYHPQKRTN